MTEITAEIEHLRNMTGPELVEQYTELFGKPPRVKNREHLWKRCAWKVQEQRLGGLSGAAKDRLEELIGEIEIPKSESERTIAGKLKKPRKPGDPPLGSVITRVWHGKTIEVKVVEGGYEHEGVVYRTLTETVRGITGSHWNPKIFFKLKERKRK